MSLGFLMALALAASAPTPPPEPPHKVEGVTVTGQRRLPLKPCNSRDQVCIATVVTELKERFPERFAAWCNEQEAQASRDRFNAGVLGFPPDQAMSFEVPRVVRGACASDRK